MNERTPTDVSVTLCETTIHEVPRRAKTAIHEVPRRAKTAIHEVPRRGELHSPVQLDSLFLNRL
jgi:hypothetical protein